jgi:uncharacterized RDD family membrane protein YckC
MFCVNCGNEMGMNLYCGSCGAAAATQQRSSAATYYGQASAKPHIGETASFGIRLGGFVIDVIIGYAISFALALAVLLMAYDSEQTTDEFESLQGAATLIGIVGVYTYRWVFDSLGGTLGKRIVGLRLIDDNTGEAPGFGSGLIRTFISFFSGIPLALGYLWAAWDDETKTWHDKAAGTSVVRAR